MNHCDEITLDEYRLLVKKSPKYGNRQDVIDGIAFDSRAEAARYRELRQLEQAGAIQDLTLQPAFELQAAFLASSGEIIRALAYVADFAYQEGSQRVVEDCKGAGAVTAAFKIKRKLFLARYPDVDFRVLDSKTGRDLYKKEVHR